MSYMSEAEVNARFVSEGPAEPTPSVFIMGAGVVGTALAARLVRAAVPVIGLHGRQIELVPGERVVQAWRVAGWDPGVYSVVRFTLRAEGGKTRFVIDHDAYPAAQHDHLSGGWLANYIEPLTAYFARAAG